MLMIENTKKNEITSGFSVNTIWAGALDVYRSFDLIDSKKNAFKSQK